MKLVKTTKSETEDSEEIDIYIKEEDKNSQHLTWLLKEEGQNYPSIAMQSIKNVIHIIKDEVPKPT